MRASGQFKQPLSSLNLFHLDRGKEFDNQLLAEGFNTFNIQRSLSKKGTGMTMRLQRQHLKILKLRLLKGKS
ncbi:hypothetical protein BHC51_10950 [Snodgrassella alvi]|jgi:putative transposase|nr:hypothetical protein BHC51_10950 [Snodgrassella alvi]